MQSTHARIGWDTGRRCPRCRKRKRADHLDSSSVGLVLVYNFVQFLQVDVTELVDGHSSYLSAAQLILEHLELNTYYPVFVPFTIAVSK